MHANGEISTVPVLTKRSQQPTTQSRTSVDLKHQLSTVICLLIACMAGYRILCKQRTVPQSRKSEVRCPVAQDVGLPALAWLMRIPSKSWTPSTAGGISHMLTMSCGCLAIGLARTLNTKPMSTLTTNVDPEVSMRTAVTLFSSTCRTLILSSSSCGQTP